MSSYNHTIGKNVKMFRRRWAFISTCVQGKGRSKRCDSCYQKIEPGDKFLLISLISAGRNDELKLCPSCAFDIGGRMRKAFTKKERALSDAKKVVEEL